MQRQCLRRESGHIGDGC